MDQKWITNGGVAVFRYCSAVQARDRLIYQDAPDDKLAEYGFNTPNMTATLTLADGTVYEVQVGDSNPEGTTYYVRLASNNDVYTVDKSWYDTLAGIITNPPYVPATFSD